MSAPRVTDEQALAAYQEAERHHWAGAPTSIAIGRELLTLRAERDAALAEVARVNRYSPDQPRIVDRCPSCWARSLFIGAGGYLTCSVIGCKEPGTGEVMGRNAAEVARMKPVVLAAGMLTDARRERLHMPPEEYNQAHEQFYGAVDTYRAEVKP